MHGHLNVKILNTVSRRTMFLFIAVSNNFIVLFLTVLFYFSRIPSRLLVIVVWRPKEASDKLYK